jgi:hypothetical protein
MSGPSFSRRAVAIGGGIAAALGLTAIGITVPRLFGRRYRQTPYDDLLAQLVDREAAVKLGKVAYEKMGEISGIADLYPKAPALASELRQRLERRTLAEVTRSDLATGRLVEIKGWVLPETMVLLSVLAALES